MITITKKKNNKQQVWLPTATCNTQRQQKISERVETVTKPIIPCTKPKQINKLTQGKKKVKYTVLRIYK